jgi:DNA-binding SARP family transcriptional activator
MWRIELFGVTTVTTGDGIVSTTDLGGDKPRRIMEILALSAGVPVPKDHLAELLWDGQPPPSYLGTLESYVCVLRRTLGLGRGRGATLRTVMRGYLLDPEEVSVDLLEFRRLFRHSTVGADPRAALGRLEEALALVRGDLLVADAYAAWAVTERETFRRELVEAATLAATHATALGEDETAVRLAHRAIAADALSEDAWCLLMGALWRTGRTTEALRAYLELKDHLATELGVDPAGGTQDLYLRILRSEGVDQRRGARDACEEVRVLVHLLRQAVASVRSTDGLGPDHALARAVADLVA